MGAHFLHRHVLDTVVILEEVTPPPPSTVHPMRHAVPPAGPEKQAYCHRPVCQGSGAEEAAACGDGDKG